MNTQPQRESNPAAPFDAADGERPSRWPLIFIFAFVAIVAGVAFLDTQRRPRLADGPLLQISGPHQLGLVWRLSGQPDLRPGHAEAKSPRGSVSAGAARAEAGGYHRATLADVKPGETYELTLFNPGLFGRMVSITGRLPIAAPPAPGGAFRFLAFGDSGNGSNTQRNLAEQMMKARPDLVVHTGDLIYPKGDAEDYRRNFFEPYRELLRAAPFMPSLGNHDVATAQGRPYLDVFTLPENGPPGVEPERNYWFDFGDARFVALDTNRAEERGAIPEAIMRERVAPWLRGVLSDTTQRWKFVFFHHPPYTGSTHAAADQAFVKEIFVPIFDATGVDVVFNGHNHLYERTKPIRADRIVESGQGTIYIVTGAGGTTRYPEVQPPPPYMETYNSDVFSFTQIDVRGDQLELKQIDEKGNVIDTLALTKSTATAAR